MSDSKGKTPQLLNEFEAAALVGMSPDLLRWLTTHAPKYGSERKLKIALKKSGLYLYDREELTAFDTWLKLPWPCPPGSARPNIPSRIREEIKIEAGGACAICHSHAGSCEAAHLDPIHKSHNNHPENLLWLCANHHTEYDKGLFGPTEANAKFVFGFKSSLAFQKKQNWRMQGDAKGALYSILSQCSALQEQLRDAKTPEQVVAVESVASETLTLIPKLGPVSETDPNYKVFLSLKPQLAELGKKAKAGTDLGGTLNFASKVRSRFAAEAGYVNCPLCDGKGVYTGNDCPVCNGEREIRKDDVQHIDLSRYEDVTCPLCDGGGSFNGDDCPACDGEGALERRFAEEVSVGDYRPVTCPLCEGKGRHEGDDCPECGGDGEMERRFAERVELRDYKRVTCPLCDGKGLRKGDDCPECGGDGEMERRFAERVELRDYKNVTCPLCNGKGRYEGDDCPECGGDGEMERRFAERVELNDYKNVPCPLCEGRGKYEGDDCPVCAGDGEMTRRLASEVDLSEYKQVICPACRGNRPRRCDFCNGEGTTPRWRAEQFE